eukprot:scaffold188487_cov38-Prasinocladus_malaysianus.AAC.1
MMIIIALSSGLHMHYLHATVATIAGRRMEENGDHLIYIMPKSLSHILRHLRREDSSIPNRLQVATLDSKMSGDDLRIKSRVPVMGYLIVNRKGEVSPAIGVLPTQRTAASEIRDISLLVGDTCRGFGTL